MQINKILTSRYFVSVLIFILIFKFGNLKAQPMSCGNTPSTGSSIVATSSGCGYSSSAYVNRYQWHQTYIPDPLTDNVKVIKVSFNVFQDSAGGNNFQSTYTPNQNYDKWYLINIFLAGVNARFGHNAYESFLLGYPDAPSDPLTNPIVVDLPDARIQFDLGPPGQERIYFYQDDNLNHFPSQPPANDFWAYIYQDTNRSDESKYNTLNIIFSEGYYQGAGGYNFHYPPDNNFNSNNAVVTLGAFVAATDNNFPFPTFNIANICHELGHALGLWHTYDSDFRELFIYNFLDDVFGPGPPGTYPHPNNVPSCNDPHDSPTDLCTNNLMGGRTHEYYSPKQVGRMHRTLALFYPRKYLKDCIYNPTPLDVTTNETWDFDIQLDRDIRVQNGATLDLTCKLSMPDGAKIIVEPGCTLIVDAIITNNCNGAWSGMIEVKENAVLQLLGNSEIYLTGNGKILIHESVNGNGILVFESGAHVFLESTNSTIEIQGNLQIGNNADFTFYPTTGPHGYVLFSSSAVPSNNVIAGVNSSMTFKGNDKFKKFLEITQESVYSPNNLVAFTCSSGTVAMSAGTRLQMSGGQTNITFYNTRVTSTIKANDPGNPNPYNGHRGLTLFGQPNVTVNNCLFEYGKYGIYGFLTYGGAPLNITSSTFRYCNYGLWTQDKGVSLTSCNFYGNTNTGWWAQYMSFPSTTRYGQCGLMTSSNPLGISFDGTATSNLFMFDPSVLNNTVGVAITRVPLYVQCGTISSNSQWGILLGNNASLDMSYNVNNTGVAAQVTAINNGVTIKPWYATGLNLNGGRNDLTPLVSGLQNVVNGDLIWGCTETTIIDAYRNKWNALGNPASSADYLLYGHDISQDCNITLVDNTPITPTPCGQAVPPPCPECRDSDPLYNCEGCEEINTEDFDATKVNEATQISIELTKETQAANNYRDAVSLFHQILTAEIPNPTSEEKYILSLGYKKMLESLGNAFSSGQITRAENASSPASEVQQTLDVLDNIIVEANVSGNYYKKFTASLEKAQVYRVADRRELALPVLDDILTWANAEDIDYVQGLRCAVSIEHLVLINEIPLGEIEEIMEAPCSYIPNGNRMSGNSVMYDEAVLTVAPNPIATTYKVTTYVPEDILDAQIVVYDLVGSKVSVTNVPVGLNKIELNSTELKNGIYFFTLQGNGATMSKVKVAVMQ